MPILLGGDRTYEVNTGAAIIAIDDALEGGQERERFFRRSDACGPVPEDRDVVPERCSDAPQDAAACGSFFGHCCAPAPGKRSQVRDRWRKRNEHPNLPKVCGWTPPGIRRLQPVRARRCDNAPARDRLRHVGRSTSAKPVTVTAGPAARAPIIAQDMALRIWPCAS